MISDARGGHVSPGVYTEERDVTYAAKTLGITSLGLAGETVKGPAFQPILISDWAEFVDYFGGTSPEQFKGTGYPKYELPYIAKSYLSQSKRLYVSRALGLSGYDAGSAMTVGISVGGEKTWFYNNSNLKEYSAKTEDEVEFIENNIVSHPNAIFARFASDAGLTGNNYSYDRVNQVEVGENRPSTIKPNTYTYSAITEEKIDDTGDTYYVVSYNVYPVTSAPTTYPVVVFRSKGAYDGTADGDNDCTKQKYEIFNPIITGFSIGSYTEVEYNSICEATGNDKVYPITGLTAKLGGVATGLYHDNEETKGFGITFYGKNGDEYKYSVSLNPADPNYIYNLFSTDPKIGPEPVYVEALYDYAMREKVAYWAEHGTGEAQNMSFISASSIDERNYKEYFRCAVTPWIVSEVKDATKDAMNIKKLFKFYTISDGNAANYQVKISIQNIKPDKGTFDVVVRDFYDSDSAQVVLEKYSNCSMVEGNANFIGLKIGTSDGSYPSRSKYITVKMGTAEGIDECVPAGFLGYPMPKYGCNSKIQMAYNTDFDFDIKPKRQFFGLNSKILDVDVLNYKGVDIYSNGTDDANPANLTNGFHMDSIINLLVKSGTSLYVDSVEGFSFTTVNPVQNTKRYTKIPRILTEAYMEDTIYEDINTRKFTVYPYGGFDGWDIYREQRTNGDYYKATNYPASAYSEDCPFMKATSDELNLNETLDLHLPNNAINSDYYAYLGAIRQFANPNDTDINIFATPGIDWVNNTLLVEDALDMVEDADDGRGGDALYVITTPMNDVDGNRYLPLDVTEKLEDSNIDTSYACTYYPWVKYFDNSAKRYVDLPVTKDVVRNMAETDNTSYPWFAPAGVSRGSVECQAACYKTTLPDEDTLYEGFINPVKSFAVDGVKVWGNKTMYSIDSPLNRVNVRRLMLRVKKLVTSAAKNLIFEQYDVTLEKQFRSLVEPILNDVKTNRGIVDYRILTECTPETRDQHILPAKILVKPTPALEYISISFIVYPEQVSFSDEL